MGRRVGLYKYWDVADNLRTTCVRGVLERCGVSRFGPILSFPSVNLISSVRDSRSMAGSLMCSGTVCIRGYPTCQNCTGIFYTLHTTIRSAAGVYNCS